MVKKFPDENFTFDIERYNRYVQIIIDDKKNLTKDQIKYLKLYNEYLYIYTNNRVLPDNVEQY